MASGYRLASRSHLSHHRFNQFTGLFRVVLPHYLLSEAPLLFLSRNGIGDAQPRAPHTLDRCRLN